MAKHEKEKKEPVDDSTWDEDWEDNVEEEPAEQEEEEAVPEVDITKLKFTKINGLKDGMEDVNVEAEVDFLGETYGKGFGEAPYAIGFIKDKTGEIKMTFWGDDVKKAKPGVKIRVIGGMVNTYRDQIQLNADRKRGVDFV
jgi:hypothetical protein